ncbi:hypothetical protein PVAND_007782 [Polypedilum vanderplanki]|uniref:Sm domain-containing protein n=1 Tax=Polypedilum vanderplanki TaxID=319348 RepID=A0A9J6C894_POLVA|nr:hypothetical protein PVAND_007782 [Polypedilum vanderplanki]
MALEENSSKEKTEDKSKSDSNDEELDLTSENFNPLKALYSKNVKLPVKNVKRFDNLAIFLSRLKKAGDQIDSDLSQQPTTSKKVKSKEEQEEDEKYHITNAGRKFLKEQAPVHRGKKSKFTRDLIQRMETKQGPLSLLQKFRSNHTKVKIYIRKEHGIRGHLIGFIVAFDKHCNLTVSDCTEVWTRRKFKFSESKIIHTNPSEDCSKLLAKMKINVPEISVKSLNRKNVVCTRKLNQIMVRGEDVVLVCEYKE